MKLEDVYAVVGDTYERLNLSIVVESTSVDDSDHPLVKMQPWDPALGAQGVACNFEPGLAPFFFGERPGEGSVRVTVENNDPLLPYGPEYRNSQRETALVVFRSRIRIMVGPTLNIWVGQSVNGFFEIELPDGAVFSTERPFTANISEERGLRLLLQNVTVFKESFWEQGSEVEYKLPFDIEVYTWGGSPFALLSAPEPASYVTAWQARYEGLGDYIKGLRPLTDNVAGRHTVFIKLHPVEALEGVDYPSPDASFVVVVEPTTLELELRSEDDPDHNNSLVLEDRFVMGDLLGSFFIQVSAGGEVIYDSHQEASFEGFCTASSLEFEKIYLDGPDGERHELPFAITANIAHQDVARFTLAHAMDSSRTDGSFKFWGRMADLVKAVRDGHSSLSVRLQGVVNPDEEWPPVYTMPQGQSLSIYVPPPLVAEFTAWRDDTGELSLPDPTETPPEIIRSNGTVTGRVVNHREVSKSEKVYMLVWDTNGELQQFVLNDAEGVPSPVDKVQPWGDWSQEVTRLTKGVNHFKCVAWKPIHSVIGPGNNESADECYLEGVTPYGLQVLYPPDGQIILYRTQSARVKRGRCTGSQLVVTRDGTHVAAIDLGGSYEFSDVPTGAFTLPERTGDYQLRVHAHNDFGPGESPPVILRAPEPTLESIRVTPLGPAKDDRNVGYSCTKVRLLVRVNAENSLGLKIDGQTVLTNSFPDFSVELPRNGDLQVGPNSFDIQSRNEFADSRKETVVIERRDHIYDLGGYMAVNMVDHTGEADKLLELYVTTFSPAGEVFPGATSNPSGSMALSVGHRFGPFRTKGKGITLSNSARSLDGLFNVGFLWRCWNMKDEYDRSTWTPAEFRVRITLWGTVIDPDWQLGAVAAAISRSWVSVVETRVDWQILSVYDFYTEVTLTPASSNRFIPAAVFLRTNVYFTK